MNSALAIRDFDEAEQEESNSPLAPRGRDFLIESQLNAACGKLIAARATSSVHEWYDQSEKHPAKYTSIETTLQAFRESLEQGGALNRELSELAAEWRLTRQKTSSSIVKLAMHPSYQRIIGKGSAAIPFILLELQRAPDHWFWALVAITGEDPVSEEHRGDLEAMALDWVEWGRQSGYI
jgi:hypothetical protein